MLEVRNTINKKIIQYYTNKIKYNKNKEREIRNANIIRSKFK